MKRINAGKYELEVDGVTYEVLKRDIPVVEWFVFRDKVALGTFSTYRDARKAVHTDIESVPTPDTDKDSEAETSFDSGAEVTNTSVINDDDDEVSTEEDDDSENYSHEGIFSDAV